MEGREGRERVERRENGVIFQGILNGGNEGNWKREE